MSKDTSLKALNKALLERQEEWPHRGKGYENFQKEMQKLYAEISDTSLKTPKVDQKHFQKLLKKPVFICGYMKSGTTLALTLLDNHPELLCFPGDTHINNYMRSFKDYGEKDIYFWLSRMVNPTGQPPYWFLRDKGELRSFLQLLKSYGAKNPSEPFIHAVLFGLYGTIYSPAQQTKLKYWVEKTPANEFYVDRLKKAYPHAKFIHILRHPVTNFISSAKLEKIRCRYRGASKVINDILSSYEVSQANQKAFGAGKYTVFHYENFVQDLDIQLQKIYKFLDIKSHVILKKPTIRGKGSSANSISSEKAAQVKGEIHKRSMDFDRSWGKLSEEEKTVIASKAGSIIEGYPYGEIENLQSHKKPLMASFYKFSDIVKYEVLFRIKNKLKT